MASRSDTIYLRNFNLTATVGPDRWHRAGKSQPVILSVRLAYNIRDAAATDDVVKTIDYGSLCKHLTQYVQATERESKGWKTLYEFAGGVGKEAVGKAMEMGPSFYKGLEAEAQVTAQVEVVLPKGALRVEGGVGLGLEMRGGQVAKESVEMMVRDLRVPCIIGVNKHERLEKQTVVVGLKMSGPLPDSVLAGSGQEVVRTVAEVGMVAHAPVSPRLSRL